MIWVSLTGAPWEVATRWRARAKHRPKRWPATSIELGHTSVDECQLLAAVEAELDTDPAFTAAPHAVARVLRATPFGFVD